MRYHVHYTECPGWKNISEFFVKFYLSLSESWSRSQRDGKVIQRNSDKKQMCSE